MNDKKYKFISPTKGELGVSQVISEIEDFVNEEPRSFYRLVIGSDSQTKAINGKAEINFVTAIVVHRRGRGARYFWKKEKRYVKVPVLRDKIYTETTMSLEIAEEFVPEMRKRKYPTKKKILIPNKIGS